MHDIRRLGERLAREDGAKAGCGLVTLLVLAFLAGPSAADAAAREVEHGRTMYMDGVLPSGETMSGLVLGDVRLSGQQVICSACHRRSGLGSTEGQNTVPAVTGDILYSPLRLPTSKPPLAPTLRPAYTRQTLKRAIRDGIGADGKPLGPLMPRYPLDDAQLDKLLAFLEQLPSSPAPGVTDEQMHFATVVSDDLDPAAEKALLDVLQLYFAQHNAQTRHEADRSEHAPWHKAWRFKPYRDWTLHVWRLHGPPAGWAEQLRTAYREQPVFAMVSGLVKGDWQPVHGFCEDVKLPCVFPVTDLPVDAERDFYSIYLNRGMSLEAEAIADHLLDTPAPGAAVTQVYRLGNARGQVGAARLAERLRAGGIEVKDLALPEGSATVPADLWQRSGAAAGSTVVLWLDAASLGPAWQTLADERGTGGSIYLSSTLFGTTAPAGGEALLGHVYVAHTAALPERQKHLTARSAGWLRAKGVAAPGHEAIQAKAYFALKAVGGAVKGIGGFFNREYFLERIEHMMDNATYTAIYPSVSLAPRQRFVSRSAYIAKFDPGNGGQMVAVTDWRVPGAR